eukprot:g12700.t1
MWGFLRDAEVSSECINRGLMLPMSRESWVLKEACTIGNCTLNDSAVAAQVLASHEPCQAFSRPQSRQSSRPRTGSRPSSIYEVILVVVVYMRDKFTNLKLDKENQCLG